MTSSSSELLQHMLPDPFHHGFLRASVFWSSIHALSPHVDGVGSELPMEILNGLQMTQNLNFAIYGIVTGVSYLISQDLVYYWLYSCHIIVKIKSDNLGV